MEEEAEEEGEEEGDEDEESDDDYHPPTHPPTHTHGPMHLTHTQVFVRKGAFGRGRDKAPRGGET